MESSLSHLRTHLTYITDFYAPNLGDQIFLKKKVVSISEVLLEGESVSRWVLLIFLLFRRCILDYTEM